jgi:hypothetical protein
VYPDKVSFGIETKYKVELNLNLYMSSDEGEKGETFVLMSTANYTSDVSHGASPVVQLYS